MPIVNDKAFNLNQFQCNQCDFIYDPALGDPTGGIAPGTPFAMIPDTWVCPDCGATKADFIEIKPGS